MFAYGITLLLAACTRTSDHRIIQIPIDTNATKKTAPVETLIYDNASTERINTGIVTPQDVVTFAQTLKGVPYQYASCDPSSGFDCSGFIYYVFDHFHIKVPRSSVNFTDVGKTVDKADAKPGDIILFTGTDPSNRTVGHIGIVSANMGDSLTFIHSSSGKANGVTTSPLDEYYKGRFVTIIRVFKQNETPLP